MERQKSPSHTVRSCVGLSPAHTAPCPGFDLLPFELCSCCRCQISKEEALTGDGQAGCTALLHRSPYSGFRCGSFTSQSAKEEVVFPSRLVSFEFIPEDSFGAVALRLRLKGWTRANDRFSHTKHCSHSEGHQAAREAGQQEQLHSSR